MNIERYSLQELLEFANIKKPLNQVTKSEIEKGLNCANNKISAAESSDIYTVFFKR